MLMNKPSLNMWYIQKELFLSVTSFFRRHLISNLTIFQKIDKTIEALSGSGTTATSGSSSQVDDSASENENTGSVSVQQYLTDAKVKAEIDAFATKFAGSMTSAFVKAVKEAQACATSAEKKKITKIQVSYVHYILSRHSKAFSGPAESKRGVAKTNTSRHPALYGHDSGRRRVSRGHAGPTRRGSGRPQDPK